MPNSKPWKSCLVPAHSIDSRPGSNNVRQSQALFPLTVSTTLCEKAFLCQRAQQAVLASNVNSNSTLSPCWPDKSMVCSTSKRHQARRRGSASLSLAQCPVPSHRSKQGSQDGTRLRASTISVPRQVGLLKACQDINAGKAGNTNPQKDDLLIEAMNHLHHSQLEGQSVVVPCRRTILAKCPSRAPPLSATGCCSNCKSSRLGSPSVSTDSKLWVRWCQ